MQQNFSAWLKCALLEAPVLMALVAHFFVSGRLELLGAAAIIVGVFALQRPTREKLIRDLDLSMTEQLLLDDPNYVVAEVGGGPGQTHQNSTRPRRGRMLVEY